MLCVSASKPASLKLVSCIFLTSFARKQLGQIYLGAHQHGPGSYNAVGSISESGDSEILVQSIHFYDAAQGLKLMEFSLILCYQESTTIGD